MHTTVDLVCYGFHFAAVAATPAQLRRTKRPILDTCSMPNLPQNWAISNLFLLDQHRITNKKVLFTIIGLAALGEVSCTEKSSYALLNTKKCARIKW